MTLYALVDRLTDRKLPPFGGAGIIRAGGGQVPYGKGRGKFFLSHCLTLKAVGKGKLMLVNTPVVV